MTSEKEKQKTAASNESGHEENADPRCDAKEAVAAEEAASSKVKPRRKKQEKLVLMRVTLERIVPHRGEVLIALPIGTEDLVQQFLDQIDEKHGLEDFVDYDWDDMDVDLSPVDVVGVEVIDGDAKTARFKARAFINEYDEELLELE